MKNFPRLFSILIFLGITAHISAQSTTRVLDSLYAAKNYFGLRSALQKSSYLIPEYDKLKYDAVINNVFNKPKLSNDDISNLLNRFKDSIDEKTKSAMLRMKLYNDYRLCSYKEAAETSKLLVDKYKAYFDSSEYDDVKNEHVIWSALSGSPRQLVNKSSAVEINMKKDIAGLLNVPAQLNNRELKFVFDTGANISVIRKSLADKYGLKELDAKFYVSSATGGKVKSGLALADSLRIGSMLFQNVVFLVFPDSALSFPSANYYINGIIGFPVIEAMGEIEITKDLKLIIPENDSSSSLDNMAIENLMPLITASINGKDFIFTFDTGAQTSSLSSKYYDYLKSDTTVKLTIDTSHIGGAGGDIKIPTVNIKNVLVRIGGNEASLNNLKVYTIPLREEDKYFYGNLGQDIIGKFNTMIINFDKMYLKFE